AHDLALPNHFNNDQWWSRECNCDPRKWKAVRDRLIQKGFVSVIDGNLWSEMAKQLHEEAVEYSNKQRERAKQRRNKLNSDETQLSGGKNHNENNAPKMPFNTQHSTLSIQHSEREEKSRKKRSSPLPENFIPIDLSDSNREEFEKFKAYHLARDSRFANWSQAWRNWQLKAREFNQQRGVYGQERSVLAACDRVGKRFREQGATGNYVPGSSGPQPLHELTGPGGMDMPVRQDSPNTNPQIE